MSIWEENIDFRKINIKGRDLTYFNMNEAILLKQMKRLQLEKLKAYNNTITLENQACILVIDQITNIKLENQINTYLHLEQ